MDKKQLIRQESMVLNYIYNLLYQVLALIVPLITTPYVARVLQADGVGEYSYGISITTYFLMFGNLGIATYGQMKIASVRNDDQLRSKIFWEILIARSITMALMFGVYLGYALLISINEELMIALSLTIFAGLFDITWFLQGLEKFKTIMIRNFVIKIASVILIFTFVNNKDDLIIYALIIQGSTLLGNLSIINSARNYLIKTKLSDFKIIPHLKSSMIFFIPSVATSVYTVLDKIMLGGITNSSLENGYYDQSLKIVQIAITIVTSVSTVTLPRMTFLYINQDTNAMKSILKNSIQFLLFISIPITMGLILLSNKIIPWFLGSGYDKSIVLLQLLSFLIISMGLNNTIGKQCLMANGKIKMYNISIICGALINVVLNIYLIPTLASIGAATSAVITETFILVLFICFSREWISIKDIVKYSRKYILASLLMGAFLVLFGNSLPNTFINIFVLIVLGATIYFTILLLTKEEFVVNIIRKAKYQKN
ncbi:flippase [Bacillus sp. OTU530]|uniref:flippase n=1 Tax=Bacillus sp. OTU530 TaxID=3043862 RepID=UPI00313C7ECA